MKKAVAGFVDAYNDAGQAICRRRPSTTPPPRPPARCRATAPPLGLQRQMRALLGASSGASTAFARLSDIGLEMQRDGTLSVNGSKLDNALANLPELKKLFANGDSATPAQRRLRTRFRALADRMLGIDGALTTRNDGLQPAHQAQPGPAGRDWTSAWRRPRSACARSTPRSTRRWASSTA